MRIAMNDCKNIKNVVDSENFTKTIDETLSQFINYLVSINGPFARYGFIYQCKIAPNEIMAPIGTGKMDNRIFMKDGSHIIRNIEFISPVQQYLKSTIHYYGDRIDSACSDGTTTAMLLASIVLKHFYEHRNYFNVCTTHEFFELTRSVYNELIEEFKSSIITKEFLMQEYGCTINEAATAIAYLQAYTSTGGDKEIAKAVSEYFKDMPPISWEGKISTLTPSTESREYRVRAFKKEYEVYLDSMFSTYQNYNNDRGRTYKMDHIDLLVLPKGLADASVETEEVYSYIKNSDPAQPLLILVPGGSYLGTQVLVNIDALAFNTKKHVSVCTYGLPLSYSSPINFIVLALIGKANKPEYNGVNNIEDCIIHDVSVFHNGHQLCINNLTPKDDRIVDTNIHPGETYPDDYPWYTETKEFLTKYYIKQKQAHVKNAFELNDIEDGLSIMCVKKSVYLCQGGLTHEMAVTMPVLEDAIGAALASVKYGFIFNGTSKFLRVVYNVLQKYSNKENKSQEDQLKCSFLELFLDCIIYLNNCMYGPLYRDIDPKKDSSAFCKDKYKKLENALSYFDIRKYRDEPNFNKIVLKSFSSDMNKLIKQNYNYIESKWQLEYPPVQTGNLYSELLDRLNEVVSKIIMTDIMVVPGTAWVENKKTDEAVEEKK
jgi:hypothetical protein